MGHGLHFFFFSFFLLFFSRFLLDGVSLSRPLALSLSRIQAHLTIRIRLQLSREIHFFLPSFLPSPHRSSPPSAFHRSINHSCPLRPIRSLQGSAPSPASFHVPGKLAGPIRIARSASCLSRCPSLPISSPSPSLLPSLLSSFPPPEPCVYCFFICFSLPRV